VVWVEKTTLPGCRWPRIRAACRDDDGQGDKREIEEVRPPALRVIE
jgi:hypothetical protein